MANGRLKPSCTYIVNTGLLRAFNMWTSEYCFHRASHQAGAPLSTGKSGKNGGSGRRTHGLHHLLSQECPVQTAVCYKNNSKRVLWGRKHPGCEQNHLEPKPQPSPHFHSPVHLHDLGPRCSLGCSVSRQSLPSPWPASAGLTFHGHLDLWIHKSLLPCIQRRKKGCLNV